MLYWHKKLLISNHSDVVHCFLNGEADPMNQYQILIGTKNYQPRIVMMLIAFWMERHIQ